MNSPTFDAQLSVSADLLRLASAGFAYPESTSLHTVRDIATGVLEAGPADDALRALLQQSLQLVDVERQRAVYMDIFLRGAVPITESHAVSRFNAVADVCAFYNAFGVVPRAGEAPDSLMHELEFAAVLCAMAVHAPTAENREVTIDALSTFLEEHVHGFLEKMSAVLSQQADGEFYSNMVMISQHVLDNYVAAVIAQERSRTSGAA